MSEIVDVPSDVLERLQGDSKAIRELLEKQDLEARKKEEEALKKAENDAVVKAELEAKVIEEQAKQDEELKLKTESDLAEKLEKEKNEAEFRSKLIENSSVHNEKLNDLIVQVKESDGSIENEKTVKILEELRDGFKAQEETISIFRNTSLILALILLCLPAYLICRKIYRFFSNL